MLSILTPVSTCSVCSLSDLVKHGQHQLCQGRAEARAVSFLLRLLSKRHALWWLEDVNPRCILQANSPPFVAQQWLLCSLECAAQQLGSKLLPIFPRKSSLPFFLPISLMRLNLLSACPRKFSTFGHLSQRSAESRCSSLKQAEFHRRTKKKIDRAAKNCTKKTRTESDSEHSEMDERGIFPPVDSCSTPHSRDCYNVILET